MTERKRGKAHRRMTGKMLQDAAVELARSKGYMAAHFRQAPSRSGYITPYSYDTKGFPDLVLVSPVVQRMVVVEVKGDGDRMRDEQWVWLAAFDAAGVPTLILTSKVWRAGELEVLLDGP